MNYQSNNGFNSALLINLQKQDPPSVSPPSLSPRLNNQSENTSSIYNYLPSDLITKIDTLSPAQRDLSSSSQHMSDIEMKSNEDKKSLSSYNEDNDEIVLNQYEDDIKFYGDIGNELTQPGSLSTNHKSSTNSNNSTSSASYIEKMKMNFINNYNTASGRKFSMPGWMPQNAMLSFQGGNASQNIKISNPQKGKKKSKKKKKKEKNEYTIEMFGRRGWICEHCNNFNYDSRHKCNRCGIPKMAKLINTGVNSNNQIDSENNNHKGDWCCHNCGNINYAFRLVCNRCQVPKGEDTKVVPSM